MPARSPQRPFISSDVSQRTGRSRAYVQRMWVDREHLRGGCQRIEPWQIRIKNHEHVRRDKGSALLSDRWCCGGTRVVTIPGIQVFPCSFEESHCLIIAGGRYEGDTHRKDARIVDMV